MAMKTRNPAWTHLLVMGLAVLGGCTPEPALRFNLIPAVVSACKQPVPVAVSWDVTPLGLKQVRVEVNNLGRPPKLWFVGESKGTEQGGAWAHDGFTVTFRAMNGVELAKRTLTTTPCPEIDWL